MRIEKKKLKGFDSERGLLIPLEFYNVDFEPVRLFYVTNVPKGIRRGEHSHINTKQLLICVKGQIGVSLIDNNKDSYFILDENEYVYVSDHVWDAQDFLTGNDVLLVLCSTNYNEDDYIFNR